MNLLEDFAFVALGFGGGYLMAWATFRRAIRLMVDEYRVFHEEARNQQGKETEP